ncbi:MAG: DUF1549 domain-containing protein, partial [Planctomycetales bacterium]
MLLKATGAVPHGGGVVLRHSDSYYKIVQSWIANGAKFNKTARRATSISIHPDSLSIPTAGQSRQLRVVAAYEDNTTRDVTAESFMESSDREVVSVNRDGLVTSHRRGESAMLVRYEGNYAAMPIIVMGDRSGFQWEEVPANNQIDSLVFQKLKRVKTSPGRVCTDAEFIRRVYLDLVGLPPSAARVTAFLADGRDQKIKRDELVDRLVGNSDFIEHWTNKWSDMLQVNTQFLGKEGATGLREWIRQQVAENTPYDKFVRKVITASGSNRDNPAASYFKVHRDPGQLMENTTQLFLGVRFNCNKCHDHPFERWTQNDYYHLAAFFAQIDRQADEHSGKRTVAGTAIREELPLFEVVLDSSLGEVKHLRTGQVAEPRFPFQYESMPPLQGTRRQQFSDWLTSSANPYFARSYVNRIWSYLTGVGLIEPVDDIRAGNPPSNPELLEWLTQKFIEDRFDVHKLIKTICKSRTYQLSVGTNRWNQDDRLNYSHATARRLNAEVLYDTLLRVLGSPSRLPAMPPGSRAAELINPSEKLADGFLDMFGRPPRVISCECERADGVSMGPVLGMIMGSTMNDALTDPDNDLAKLVASQPDNRKVVQQLFLAILNRPATEREIELGARAMETRLNEQETSQLKLDLEGLQRSLDGLQALWERSLAPAVWNVVQPIRVESSAGARMAILPDHSILVSGPLAKDVYKISLPVDEQPITGFRIEVLTDESLPKGGPGRSKRGNFVLNEVGIRLGTDPIDVRRAEADFSQE